MSIFNDITPTDAEVNSVKSSTDYSQDIYPDEPSAPLTDGERESIDRHTNEARPNDPFANVEIPVERPQGEWIPPKVRQARKAAALLPKTSTIKAEEDRLFEVARHDGQPKELADAIAKARKACQKAYAVLDEARHPEIPTRPKTAEHKQAAVDAIEAAKVAVTAAIRTSEREDVRAKQYENIVSGIAEAQAKAAEALDVAAAEFARWRNLITAGDDLAKATGVFGEWHQHKDERSINPRALVGDLRRARDLANTEDPYLSGQYLYDDPTPEGELPEWTKESLANGTDWTRTVLWRLNVKHPNDPTVVDTLQRRDLSIINSAPIPALHPDAKAWDAQVGNDWD